MVIYKQDLPARVRMPTEEQERGVTISSTTKQEPQAPGRRDRRRMVKHDLPARVRSASSSRTEEQERDLTIASTTKQEPQEVAAKAKQKLLAPSSVASTPVASVGEAATGSRGPCSRQVREGFQSSEGNSGPVSLEGNEEHEGRSGPGHEGKAKKKQNRHGPYGVDPLVKPESKSTKNIAKDMLQESSSKDATMSNTTICTLCNVTMHGWAPDWEMHFRSAAHKDNVMKRQTQEHLVGPGLADGEVGVRAEGGMLAETEASRRTSKMPGGTSQTPGGEKDEPDVDAEWREERDRRRKSRKSDRRRSRTRKQRSRAPAPQRQRRSAGICRRSERQEQLVAAGRAVVVAPRKYEAGGTYDLGRKSHARKSIIKPAKQKPVAPEGNRGPVSQHEGRSGPGHEGKASPEGNSSGLKPKKKPQPYEAPPSSSGAQQELPRSSVIPQTCTNFRGHQERYKSRIKPAAHKDNVLENIVVPGLPDGEGVWTERGAVAVTEASSRTSQTPGGTSQTPGGKTDEPDVDVDWREERARRQERYRNWDCMRALRLQRQNRHRQRQNEGEESMDTEEQIPTAAHASFFPFFGLVLGHQTGAILSALDHTLRNCYLMILLQISTAKWY